MMTRRSLTKIWLTTLITILILIKVGRPKRIVSQCFQMINSSLPTITFRNSSSTLRINTGALNQNSKSEILEGFSMTAKKRTKIIRSTGKMTIKLLAKTF